MTGCTGWRAIPSAYLPPDTAAALRDGLPPYDGIDYLAFTHDHSDHFSAEAAADYLRAHPVKGVLLPRTDTPACRRLQEQLAAQGIPWAAAGEAPVTLRPEPGVTIQTLPTRHLDRRFWGVPHTALLVTLGEKRFLFTADADYTKETFPGLPPLRAAFLNPLFFHALCTGRFFRGALPAETLCVYHIPFPADDDGGLRQLLAGDLRRGNLPCGDVRLLAESGQTLLL